MQERPGQTDHGPRTGRRWTRHRGAGARCLDGGGRCLDHGARCLDHGAGLEARGSKARTSAPRSTAHGPGTTAQGAWTTAHGAWTTAHGALVAFGRTGRAGRGLFAWTKKGAPKGALALRREGLGDGGVAELPVGQKIFQAFVKLRQGGFPGEMIASSV